MAEMGGASSELKRSFVLQVLVSSVPFGGALERSRIWGVYLSDSPCSSLSSDINMGQQILVRLRPHFDPDAFFPEEDVLHTMLHEVSECSSLSIPVAHRALFRSS